MNILYKEDLGKYPLLVIDKHTADIPDTLVVVIEERLDVRCLSVHCNICPIQPMCSTANGGPELGKNVLRQYCPDIVDKYPEYFI